MGVTAPLFVTISVILRQDRRPGAAAPNYRELSRELRTKIRGEGV